MKLLLPLLVALLLLVSALALFEFDEAEAALGFERRESVPERAVVSSKLVAPAAEEAGGGAPTADEDSTRSDAANGSLPRELAMAGSLTVYEPDGSFSRTLNGSAVLEFRVPRAANSEGSWSDGLYFGNSNTQTFRVQVPVRHGRWKVRLTLGEEGRYSVRLKDAWAEDRTGSFSEAQIRSARLVLVHPQFEKDPGRIEAAANNPTFEFGEGNVVARFRRRGVFRLSIKDAATGRDLSAVTVFGSQGAQNGELPSDRRESALAIDESSPIRIDPGYPYKYSIPYSDSRLGSHGRPHYFVGSPGYAWQVARIFPTENNAQELRLQPGGDLALSFTGLAPPPAAELRIRNTSLETLIKQLPLTSLESQEFDGLALGEHQVSIEVGDPFDAPIVLASETVHITQGEPAQVELALTAPPQFERAQVAGTVTVPIEWELPRFWISLSLQEAALDGTSGHHMLSSTALGLLPGSEDTYAFDFGKVQTGRYALKLSPLSHGQLIDLRSTGLSNLSLKVPPPVDITVLLRDAETNTNAEATTLVWSSVRDPEACGVFLRRANRKPTSDRFRLRVPEGDFTVISATNLYKPISETVSALGGANFILDVVPAENP